GCSIFFFQAEDGIRDGHVTGVQTCALPILPRLYRMARSGGRYARTLELLDRSRRYAPDIPTKTGLMVGLGEERDELVATFNDLRSEERRVGKECRFRWSLYE